ncbi:hypothetical protein PAXINDRAFT_11094 [Paxillus involutus ATCC 200175]|nr:hypothetical protein PAXINDRAFT_11094 [Paxillus involutus ATCC 200175]
MSAEIPIAIIGLGGTFPGGSNTPALFYEFLRNKVGLQVQQVSPTGVVLHGDGMIEPPPDRWIHAEFMGGKNEHGKYNTTKAGFINNIDINTPALEASFQALQDSGIDYRGSKTGVYFGNLLTTMFELDEDRFEINSYNGIGKCVSIRANCISFTFDLRGPSLTVDTGKISASATAMHLALSAIRSGEIDQALVVGANTMINPEHTVSFSKLGVLSPTGSSKSFDASADGYARAEAAAAVVIKRQDLVERDGDLGRIRLRTLYATASEETTSRIDLFYSQKPLVLPAHDTIPTHAGCIIDGHRWQFRASTTAEFDNGAVVLDTVYASGTFSRVNPGFRADAPLTFDIASKLAHSCGSGHFRDYLQEVHEITDGESWGGKAYLARLEIPEGTPDVFGSGYVIHPGILDTCCRHSLTHSTLSSSTYTYMYIAPRYINAYNFSDLTFSITLSFAGERYWLKHVSMNDT